MASVISKALAGTDYKLSNGRAVSVFGNGYINQIEDDTWEQVKREHPSVVELIKSGWLTEAKAAVSYNDPISAEAKSMAMGEVVSKQNAAMDTNSQASSKGGLKVKVKKA